MEALLLEATDRTPRVSFDPATLTFEIDGESRPENVREFFDNILQFFDRLLKEVAGSGKTVTVNLKLIYFNSSSAKYILNVAKKCREFIEGGVTVVFNWHYETDDEDMKDTGYEMERMSKVPFNFIEMA